MNTNLSKTDIDILKYLVKGYTNFEIANALGLNKYSVKDSLQIIMLKLNARNRTELAYIIGKNNIIPL